MTYLLMTMVVLVFMAASAGYSILRLTLPNWCRHQSLSLRVSAAYFVGLLFIIFVVRSLTSLISNAEWAAYITLILAAITSIFSIRELKRVTAELLSTPTLLLALTACCIAPVLLIYWSGVSEHPQQDPFAHVGSLHSVRYAWIANVIEACNRMPALGQNTGQSLLAFVAGTIVRKAPYAYLYLWLMASILFFSVFVYGVLRSAISSRRSAVIAAIIVMFGNTAASLTHVLVIDSGSPFILSGYTDTLIGAASALVLIFIYHYIKTTTFQRFPVFLLMTLIIGGNFFVAAQNVLLLAALLPFIAYDARHSERGFEIVIFFFLALLVGAAIAIPQGGMLTPARFQATLNYSGIMTAAGNAARGIQVVPGYPFHFGWGGDWIFGQSSVWRDSKEYMAFPVRYAMQLLWLAEQATLNSVRVLFLPILGLLYLGVRAKKTSNSIKPKLDPYGLPFKLLFGCGLSLFCLGFLVTFAISLNGYKWELTRFSIPGITLGMIGAALLIVNLREQGRNLLASGLIVFALIGPVINILATSARNLLAIPETVSVEKAMSSLLGEGPKIDPLVCKQF